MEIYSQRSEYTLFHWNMLDLWEVVDACSIDSIVTDPPYELNFMGKGWDNSWIAFQPDTWKRCLEALKPWGYLLAFGGSRTYHRIACAIEDAGFEIRDCIMWLYGSWFPKSMDISKQIDKRWATSISRFWGYLRGILKERNMTYSDLAKHFPSKTWWITGCVHNRIEWKNMPTLEQFNKICEILDLPFDKLEEAEREVIWSKKTNLTVYQNIWDRNISWKVDITAPSTNLAKQREGRWTALKPSYEPIIVARKPLEWSCTDNVIKYWVGGINIDECRVQFWNETDSRVWTDAVMNTEHWFWQEKGNNWNTAVYKEWGRFPANTILTYDESDFEEVCWWFPNTKSWSKMSFGSVRKAQPDNTYQLWFTKHENSWQTAPDNYWDSGNASRYFYCAKASKRDRDEWLDEFEEAKTTDGCIRSNEETARKFWANSALRRNIHPTVKPCDLMQYLVRLVTPNGWTVLDPFNWSGSTWKAVMYENKDRNKNYKYIWIELTEEYLPIAKARIEYVINKGIEKEKSDPKQEEQTKQRKETALF